MENNTIGFGFDPIESEQHFLVRVPRGKGSVIVFERNIWDDSEAQSSELPGDVHHKIREKIILPKDKWNAIAPSVVEFLNKILKATGRKTCLKFKEGKDTPVERLLGKELMVLLWAVENCDMVVLNDALRNWQGLSREERWWLFTMTNAATGSSLDSNRGWRIALRYAITDNPVIEKNGDLCLLNEPFMN